MTGRAPSGAGAGQLPWSLHSFPSSMLWLSCASQMRLKCFKFLLAFISIFQAKTTIIRVVITWTNLISLPYLKSKNQNKTMGQSTPLTAKSGNKKTEKVLSHSALWPKICLEVTKSSILFCPFCVVDLTRGLVHAKHAIPELCFQSMMVILKNKPKCSLK